ncbi:tyrosine-protein phosphatase [Enterococcus sp. LJL99]
MNATYTVTQTTKNTFTFTTSASFTQKIEVYLKQTPEDSEPQFLITTEQANFTIVLPAIDFRPYFLLKIGDTHITVAERTLPIAGMNNFRDMGGYLAADGKTVKWGVLYRSDHIHNAEPKGVTYLQKLNIHTIIDFRSQDEIEKYPNKKIAVDIQTYHLDPDAHAAELSAQFTSSKDNEDRNLIDKIIEQKKKGQLVNRYDIVMEQYENFVKKEKSKAAFSELLAIAADPKAPAIIQHCRGGKDRTGFGAMLLLGVLGVSKEDLVADYMLTYSNRVARNELKMTGYKKLTNDPDILNYLYSLIETKPEFIEASIGKIEDQYGSIKNYAKSELQLTDEMIETMKKMYLE